MIPRVRATTSADDSDSQREKSVARVRIGIINFFPSFSLSLNFFLYFFFYFQTARAIKLSEI